MCGITGYIGNENAAPILLRSLKKLEYRGYDSAGIAVLCGGEISLKKTKGQIKNLEDALQGYKISGTVGIGHTRWATHGEPSDINSHPHTDAPGRIAVVHNGIIENYLKLKQDLILKGIVFRSDTDTEVIAHLINFYFTSHETSTGNILKAVMLTLKDLEGSYAIGVISADFPDRIIAARKDSPLIIGLSSGQNLLASDVPAMLSYTSDMLFLEDHEIAVLYKDHVDLLSDTSCKITRAPTKIDWDIDAAEKNGFAHFMLKEISEQPKALNDTMHPRIKESGGKYEIEFDEIQFDKSQASVPHIVIIGCGTAFHAATVGKAAFEFFARTSVEVDIASEYRYRDPIFNKDDLFIVISQSGETADTLAAMRLAKAKGTRIIAITNVVGSTLSREADSVLYTWAGPEIAVASTKAFTTQLMCLYLLALKLGYVKNKITDNDYQDYIKEILQIPQNVKTIIADQKIIAKFASLYFSKSKVFFIGRQFDYAVSMEAALKLKEIAYTHSESFAAGELKHGPIALVDKDTLLVTLATQPLLFDKIASNINEVSSRGSHNLVITYEGVAAFNNIADEIWTIPKTKAALSSITAIVPLQLFAYYCSILRGNDPDKPRNLAKSVTVE